ncbi:putative glutathione-specific gamma-glutamylcyclotransferase 2 [Schistocerca nitens]|uniref:putative glutathione-specific gamma-glutamylcyclotransferase 2 n=1 Tax=Schistocerca nitens TaxID=7011 RepID=UPI0021192318|nr:putative glutathione-specific gamma-glutamylcyclotransferase 2 [Schistocerca nitens]
MAVDHHQTGLWVFGYGSLCWNPGFDYECCLVGCVRGWSRKFWQGNTTHRGTEGKPGRVATMVQEKEGEVWGCAFLVRGEAALPYLKDRECELGGYRTLVANFEPRRADRPAFPVLLYVATPDNRHWLGDAPLPDMARHIASSSGASGHNVEYVLRLAQFVRTIAPGSDEELFELERLVVAAVRESRQSVEALMGAPPKPLHCFDDYSDSDGDGDGDGDGQAAGAGAGRHFTATVPPKKLRCLNM